MPHLVHQFGRYPGVHVDPNDPHLKTLQAPRDLDADPAERDESGSLANQFVSPAVRGPAVRQMVAHRPVQPPGNSQQQGQGGVGHRYRVHARGVGKGDPAALEFAQRRFFYAGATGLDPLGRFTGGKPVGAPERIEHHLGIGRHRGELGVAVGNHHLDVGMGLPQAVDARGDAVAGNDDLHEFKTLAGNRCA